VETRGPDHSDRLVGALRNAGYHITPAVNLRRT